MGMRGSTAAQLTAFVRRLYEPDDEAVLRLFPGSEHGSRAAALSKAVTVMGFVASARFAAASVAGAGGDAYLYHFARRPPVAGDLGAFHGLELPYVFGNSALTLDVTEGADGELSDAMMRYWVSFARDGDPNDARLCRAWPALRRGLRSLPGARCGDPGGAGALPRGPATSPTRSARSASEAGARRAERR